jgi:hypothetical protein
MSKEVVWPLPQIGIKVEAHQFGSSQSGTQWWSASVIQDDPEYAGFSALSTCPLKAIWLALVGAAHGYAAYTLALNIPNE